MAKTKPSIRTITVRSMINFLLIAAVVLLIIVGIGFRVISYRVIESKTLAVAEVILAGLTAHMKAEIMDRSDYFLRKIKSLHEVDGLAIIRSPELPDQFGLGNGAVRKDDEAIDKVFETGKPVFLMNEFSSNPHVRALIPYIASKEGPLNCLECHQVREGTVLGAVDVRLDLSVYRNLALGLMSSIALLGVVFVVLMCVNTFTIIQRHVKDPLDTLVVKAKNAYFSQVPLEPEVFASMEFEEIARKFNMFNTAVLANQTLIKEKNLELLTMNGEVEETLRQTIFTMGVVEEQRSKETADHTKRVTEYCRLIATKRGLPERDIDLIVAASPLHDIGKLGVQDAILQKPGKLTDDEYEIIKNHTGIGYAMLLHSNRDVLKAAAVIAYQHHEKWDGSGYPLGLKGDGIHIYGRIVALADVVDALSSDRVYRAAWSDEEVINYVREQRGMHFDPVLADIFLNNTEIFFAIKNRYQGRPGVYTALHPVPSVATEPELQS